MDWEQASSSGHEKSIAGGAGQDGKKLTRNAIPQTAAMAPRRAEPVNSPIDTFSDTLTSMI